MEENNRRVLAPWRQFYPLTAMRYNSKVNQVRRLAAGQTPGGPGVDQATRTGDPLSVASASPGSCTLPTLFCGCHCARVTLQRVPPSPALQLNSYIIGIIRARRAARAANGGKPPAKPDILDRVLTAAEVGHSAFIEAKEAAPGLVEHLWPGRGCDNVLPPQ